MRLKQISIVLFVGVACAIHVAAQTQAPVDKAPEATTTDTRVLLTSDSPRTKPAPSENVVASESTKSIVPNSSEPKPHPQSGSDDEWQFQLTPYLWIVGINGDAGVGNITVGVDSGLGSSNVHLNFGFMSTFEARKNKLVLLTDLQYSNLGTDRPTPGPFFSNATADFKTFILDPEVGYRILENPDKGNSIDVLGGIRYWHLRSDLSLSGGFLLPRSATATRDWVDAVGGVRARIHLSPRWFLSGKADLGGGGSKFTYQLFGGVGVQLSKHFVLVGGYRDLSVDYNKDNFLFDMSLHGPIVGVGIKF